MQICDGLFTVSIVMMKRNERNHCYQQKLLSILFMVIDNCHKF